MAKKRVGGEGGLGGGDGGGGAEKKKDGNKVKNEMEIVLKLNLHCEGCTTKIRKIIVHFPGVRTVEFEGETKVKIAADPKVDPTELRKRVEKKTNKTVEILSPLPKKEDKKKDNSQNDAKPKEKEFPVATVVLKVPWHCDGCGDRIYKTILSYKGVYEVSLDRGKDLVTVKGKMDSKKMVEDIKQKMKKPLEIVPEKKEEKKKDIGNGSGDKNNNKNSSNTKKEKGGGNNAESNNKTSKVGQFVSGSGCVYRDELGQVVDPFHAPQLFSDENPNACSIM